MGLNVKGGTMNQIEKTIWDWCQTNPGTIVIVGDDHDNFYRLFIGNTLYDANRIGRIGITFFLKMVWITLRSILSASIHLRLPRILLLDYLSDKSIMILDGQNPILKMTPGGVIYEYPTNKRTMRELVTSLKPLAYCVED